MNYAILQTTKYGLQLLCPHTNGVVHSVYRKTINIALGADLLSLQAAASPLSPISLITNLDERSMETLEIQTGQTVSIGADTIQVLLPNKTVSFQYDKAAISDTALPLQTAFSSNLLDRIKNTLEHTQTHGFRILFSTGSRPIDRLDETLVLTAAEKHIKHCTALFRTADYNAAAKQLIHLIGLGIGLTPSGDDFLCGTLAAGILCNQTSHPFIRALQRQIKEHLNDTNDISRAFLRCALNGQFSKAVIQLSHAASSEEILHAFTKIGHSSGTDTLSGIYYGACLLQTCTIKDKNL